MGLLNYTPGDLFASDDLTCILHCISSVYTLGNNPVGVHMVTKAKKNEKPTMVSLAPYLRKVADYCISEGVMDVQMHRIGCGLDKQSWTDVEAVIHDSKFQNNCNQKRQ